MIYCYYYCFSIVSGNDLQWFIIIIIVSALLAETICNDLLLLLLWFQHCERKRSAMVWYSSRLRAHHNQEQNHIHYQLHNPFQKLSTILLSGGGGTKPAVCKIKHFFYVTITLSWNSCFGYVVIYICKINVIFNRLIHYSMPFLTKLLHIFFQYLKLFCQYNKRSGVLLFVLNSVYRYITVILLL